MSLTCHSGLAHSGLCTRVEKSATRSIATGTANVNVGSSQTDMVAEKIDRKPAPESKAHRDIVCVVLRQRRSLLVQVPSRFYCVGDCTQDKVASPVLKDGEVHVRAFCCAFAWNFQGHFRERCRVCWTDLSSDRYTLPTPERHTKKGATFVTGLRGLSVELCLEDSYLLCVVSPSLHEAEASLCSFRDLCVSKSMTS